MVTATGSALNETNISGQFKYHKLDKWYDTGSLSEMVNKIKKEYTSKYVVLDKLTESISFFDKYVIKFFYDKEVSLSRVKRGMHLYPLTPKILDYRENPFTRLTHKMWLLKQNLKLIIP